MSPDAPDARAGLHDAVSSTPQRVRSSTAGRKRRLVVARVARAMARRDAASSDAGSAHAKREDVDLAGRS